MGPFFSVIDACLRTSVPQPILNPTLNNEIDSIKRSWTKCMSENTSFTRAHRAAKENKPPKAKGCLLLCINEIFFGLAITDAFDLVFDYILMLAMTPVRTTRYYGYHKSQGDTR